MAWADPAFARRHWADAGALDDEELQDLLDAAFPGCKSYAPAHSEPVPVSFQIANVLQAREIRTAAQRDGSADVIGVGDYAIRARPLTDAVKQLLRPQRGKPGVG